MTQQNGAAQLFDHLIAQHKLKNDAALSRACHVDAPVISKFRHDVRAIGPAMLLRMHDAFGTPFAEMRAFLAIAAVKAVV